ncbi:protein lozenge-like, partial [Ochlerotatus camptorhynchus]|uniref:protein lozenge-like n=1 Tax=Ochlerotatus camptorhynchus TaxID=644619 RepID=UPI0031D5E2C8
MLEPELYGGSGVSDHHHHFKNHHRHYHGHHHHHHPHGSGGGGGGSSSGDRKSSSSSRSSPRGHLHTSSGGEKLKYQNAFSATGVGGGSDGYFRYYPHQHSSYYDLSEKLDSLNIKPESGSESRKNDSNNNSNKNTSTSSVLSNGSEGAGSSGSGRKKTTVVYVGDGRSRVRRVVRTQTRHITVVSYSGRKKDTATHTTHHATVL